MQRKEDWKKKAIPDAEAETLLSGQLPECASWPLLHEGELRA